MRPDAALHLANAGPVNTILNCTSCDDSGLIVSSAPRIKFISLGNTCFWHLLFIVLLTLNELSCSGSSVSFLSQTGNTWASSSRAMGAFLDKPKTEKHNCCGEGKGLSYGLSSMQGWRVDMEDAHTAVLGLSAPGMTDWSFFAVYDGHAGSRVANYCSKHLLDHIINASFGPGGSQSSHSGSKAPDGSVIDPSLGSPTVEAVKAGIRAGFLRIDEHMRSFSELRNGMDRSGSTAVGVIISPKHFIFFNCGDSRAVLCRNSHVCFSTLDHKPCNPRERERIQNAGGTVMIQRVNGSLAVSRALGDYHYKCVDGKGPTEQLVSPEPTVCEMTRAPEQDQFVILACDGIWDVMSNEELCEFVKSRLEVSDDLERVCNEVVDTCLHKVCLMFSLQQNLDDLCRIIYPIAEVLYQRKCCFF